VLQTSCQHGGQRAFRAIYRTDIEPRGFDGVLIDGFVTDEVVSQICEILSNADRRQRMVAHNYDTRPADVSSPTACRRTSCCPFWRNRHWRLRRRKRCNWYR
jgi:hypothetical protein